MSFIAEEVFEMAEQLERNGREFYRAAALGSEGDAVELFNRLADMEKRHEDIFHGMRNERTPEESIPSTADPDDLANKYLRSMVEGKIFHLAGDPKKKLSGFKSPEEILKYAISLEKEAIAFYVGIKDSMSREADRDRIDEIISEEKSHVVDLTEQLNNYQKGEK